MLPLTFFKCLADPTRLKILLMLKRDPELCVCELTDAIASTQPKVSRHLALLKRSAVIQDRRQGQWIYYRLHDHLPRWCEETLSQTLAANNNLIKTPADPTLGKACCD